jgi:hypothetical protein
MLEVIGVWVEAIALVAIFGLDWKERQARRAEHAEQQSQTLAQLQASLDQVEVPQIPFLSLFWEQPASGRLAAGYPELRNAGFGPAVNIKFSATPTSSNPNVYSKSIPSTITGIEIPLAREGARSIRKLGFGDLNGNEWEILIQYQSLSGGRYETKLSIDVDGCLTHVEFKRIETPNRSKS